MKPFTATAAFPSRPIYSEIYPLEEFYAARGEAVPEIQRVQPEEMPEPYRALLVHNGDMTSTLETFCRERLHIEVLTQHVRENEYFREVALVLDHSKKHVEYGAIKINLDLFPLGARQEILREQQPLGRILNLAQIAFSSRPSAYLRIVSDNFISKALRVEPSCNLFGRRNSLLDAWDRPLAEIVEILPP